jgi:hypothetical protein
MTLNEYNSSTSLVFNFLSPANRSRFFKSFSIQLQLLVFWKFLLAIVKPYNVLAAALILLLDNSSLRLSGGSLSLTPFMGIKHPFSSTLALPLGLPSSFAFRCT